MRNRTITTIVLSALGVLVVASLAFGHNGMGSGWTHMGAGYGGHMQHDQHMAYWNGNQAGTANMGWNGHRNGWGHGRHMAMGYGAETCPYYGAVLGNNADTDTSVTN